MKKMLSLILAFCLALCLCVPAFAEDLAKPERAILFEDRYAYIRFDETVASVSDAFRVEYVLGGQNTPAVLDETNIQIFTGDRLEVFLQFPDSVSTITLSDLVLRDGTHGEQEVQYTDCERIHSGILETAFYWGLKHDALYTQKEVLGSLDDCYAAVGSKWQLKLPALRKLNDPYLAPHVSLTAEGLETEKDGNGLVFLSVGNGTVSFCLFDVPFQTKNVEILEKQAVKQKMLLTVPAMSFGLALYAGHWLGPVGWLAGFPVAAVYTIVTYFRALFA